MTFRLECGAQAPAGSGVASGVWAPQPGSEELRRYARRGSTR